MAGIKIYAGRGCGGPENTAAAFKAAFAAGADAALCDIRRTADGQFVAFADAGAGRLCGRNWEISAAEWGHLKPLRVLGREPIAHLDDLLNILILRPAKEFFFRLLPGTERDAADLALQVARAGVQDRVFLLARPCKGAMLAAARAAVPGLGLAVAPRTPYDLLGSAWKAGASRICSGWTGGGLAREAFYLGASLFDLRAQAEEAAAAGVEVSAGLVAHPRDARRLVELGVGAVWTSDVELAAKYL
jgi:glycerophosphoryl diester phosphodiesterase